MKQVYLIIVILSLLCSGISCGTSEPGTNPNPDTTPPLVTSVSTPNITETSAVVTWATDELATSQVEYGLDASYGSATTLDKSLVTSHSVNLSGLELDTVYHFKVESADEMGNKGTSGDYSFTTAGLSGGPEPYLGNREIKGCYYGDFGNVISVTVGHNIINLGRPGNVFVSVTSSESILFHASKVFYMDESEEVIVEATFNDTGYGLSLNYDTIVRAALSGDISEGDVEVKRS